MYHYIALSPPDCQPLTHIIFYRGSGIPAWLVRTFTRSPFGHVAILVGDTLTEAVSTGVQTRHWHSQPEDSAASVVALDTTDEARADAFLALQIGKPYDWGAITLDVLGRFFGVVRVIKDESQKRWTCSRIAAWACALAGWHGPAWTLPATPNDLYLALTSKETIHVF